MKLALNTESANALREFGQAMPIAVANIVASTHKICSVYLSVADMLGVHRQSFYDMLMLIKKAQECSAEAIEALPTLLNSTADKIDQYVVKQTLLEQKISAAGTSTGGITKVPSGKISIDENARIEYRPIEYVQLNQNGEIEHLQYDQPIYVDSDLCRFRYSLHNSRRSTVVRRSEKGSKLGRKRISFMERAPYHRARR